MTTHEGAAREGGHFGLPSDLGTIRTIMAADRTLMAWVRTSLSMLSFGFTIYKFLESAVQSDQLARTDSPQHVGLFLAGVGTLSMLLGVVSYWTTLKDLQRSEEFRLGRPTLFISLVMLLAGVALFVGIAARVV
ncbi:MAG: YidH family protein [Phenylobacterium sp.]